MTASPRTSDLIRKLLIEQLDSGMNVSAFARDRGINVRTFHGWRWRYGKTLGPGRGRPKAKALIPVVVEPSEMRSIASAGNSPVRLQLNGGTILEWPQGVSAQFIAQLVKELV